MKIDNFALTTFESCPLKFKERIVEGWTSKRKTAALGFGGALHEGLAEWYRTHDKAKAVSVIHAVWPQNVPSEDWRTEAKCIQTMVDYIKRYPSETFHVVGAPDNPLIEITFTLDTGLRLSCPDCGPTVGAWAGRYVVVDNHVTLVDAHDCCCNCGRELERIEYGGIFDGLVEFSGSVYILEHKTTSMMGSYYFNQFKPNNQVSGYVWAAGLMSGQRVGGAIINAIGIYKASATKFEREITTRSPDAVAEWLNNLHWKCEMIQEAQRTGRWPMFTQSCTQYGLCEFHSVHVLNTQNERDKMLDQQFVRDRWNFEAREGVKED